MKLPPTRWSPAALIELFTVKKQCERIFHGNEWMKEHNYAFQNADTRPRLQRRTQNICFVISISAVILKRMVKITSIFGSCRFLRIAWHFLRIAWHFILYMYLALLKLLLMDYSRVLWGIWCKFVTHSLLEVQSN